MKQTSQFTVTALPQRFASFLDELCTFKWVSAKCAFTFTVFFCLFVFFWLQKIVTRKDVYVDVDLFFSFNFFF